MCPHPHTPLDGTPARCSTGMLGCITVVWFHWHVCLPGQLPAEELGTQAPCKQLLILTPSSFPIFARQSRDQLLTNPGLG